MGAAWGIGEVHPSKPPGNPQASPDICHNNFEVKIKD